MYYISDQQAVLDHSRRAREIETKISTHMLSLDEEEKVNRFEGKTILENIPVKELINHDNCIIIYNSTYGNKNDLNDELDEIIEHYKYIPTIKNNKIQVVRMNF